MRRLLYVLAGIVLVVVLVIGLTQAGGKGGAEKAAPFDLAAAKQKLASAPQPLSGVYAQANRLLGGGTSAFDKRIANLRGHPVVVNKWASWCVPCQSEFGVFQSVATKKGAQVAFIGLDGHDADSAAKRFLAKRPLPFPSYKDPGDEIATDRKIAVGFPMTMFLDRAGRTAYIHTGPYKSDAALVRDIDRYLH